MQALGRRYVRYFNPEYRRTGILWEGRFKSSLVQSETYLLQCYRYIELNPVRAAMVDDPADCAWSSCCHNGLAVETDLCTPHDEYWKLGKTKPERAAVYRDLFRCRVKSGQLKKIRAAINKGLALGNERFKDEVDAVYGRRVRSGKIGRPKKSVI